MNSLVHGNILLELHSQNGNAPEWIHIVPSGTFKGRDGRGRFHLNNMQKVIAASLPATGKTVPIDYNHSLYAHSSDARAAGWIDRMESRADGIWAHASWTPAAAKMISEKEWRFLSPTLKTDEDGNIIRIDSVGLVNRPNLELTALNSQKASEGSAASSFRDDLCKILSLPKTADDDAVIAEVHKLVASAPVQKNRAPQKHSSLSGQDHSLLLGIRKDVDMIRDTLALHGQNFFDTAHPVSLNDKGKGTYANVFGSGKSAPWFLLDCSRPLRPLIFQNRRQLQFVQKTNMNDDNVFFERKYLYGAEARYNAGFGLPQLAFACTDPLTPYNYSVVRAAMMSQRAETGVLLVSVPRIL